MNIIIIGNLLNILDIKVFNNLLMNVRVYKKGY